MLRINKKGDGLSFNIIILAIIALLILVLLSVFVLRGAKTFNTGTTACDPVTEGCVNTPSQCGTGFVAQPMECQALSGKGSYCCKNIDGSTS